MKIVPLVLGLLLLATVGAYDSQFIPDSEITMAPTDTAMLDYCIWESTAHVNPVVGMTVDLVKVCKDVNGEPGCQSADTNLLGVPDAELEVIPQDALTQDDGCVGVLLITDNADGHYYFRMNGLDSELEIQTSEKAHIRVPEFTTLGAAVLLMIASIVIAKKRS